MVMEWQDISTAPRGGADIIGFGDGRVEIVRWGRSFGGTYGWFCRDKLGYEATHWMPLPEPPEVKP